MRARFTLVATFALLSACPSTPNVDAGPDVGPVPADSCGQPGTMGNDIGVGRFCTPRGGECSTNPIARVCIVDLAPDQGQWFCTRLCDEDSDCGMDAVCVGDAAGAGCVPVMCAPMRPDAGPTSDAAPLGDAGPPDAGPTTDAPTIDAP